MSRRRWALGLAPVCLAILARWLLEPVLETKSPFLLLILAVMLAVTIGGARVGMAGAVLGGAAGLFFLADTPRGPSEVLRSAHLLQLALYVVVSAGVTFLVDNLHQTRLRAESSAAEQARLAEQLARANRAKDEFLATLSHELRTPLSAIVGWAEVLQSGRLSEEERGRAIEAIRRNARIQTGLVSDLLDEARILAGKMRLDPLPVRIGDVVTAAIETVRPAALARNVELDATGDLAVRVWADQGRLQQVVWNLLSNAVKFTPAQGKVTTSVVTSAGCVRVAVTDEGPGLRPEFIPQAFERFRQDETSARSQGLGLGLALVKHIVEMHGGSVSAANRSDRSGSIFEVVLPELTRSIAERSAASRPGAADAERLSVLAGLRVLVVDDDTDARELMRRSLSRFGAEVRTAGSVGEAVAELQRGRPHAILTDIVMPGDDGFALLRHVRSLPNAPYRNIPTAAITAAATEAERLRALSAGFQLHLGKPVEPHQLAQAVLTLTSRRPA
ncbi:MAG TPA: hybrid sensor histidine kinase/response regulator [Vicinamibacteria bacterium]|nr:hybrid sensor histidine kinase/response regulator [Vicinamibacteria bacterium]